MDVAVKLSSENEHLSKAHLNPVLIEIEKHSSRLGRKTSYSQFSIKISTRIRVV